MSWIYVLQIIFLFTSHIYEVQICILFQAKDEEKEEENVEPVASDKIDEDAAATEVKENEKDKEVKAEEEDKEKAIGDTESHFCCPPGMMPYFMHPYMMQPYPATNTQPKRKVQRKKKYISRYEYEMYFWSFGFVSDISMLRSIIIVVIKIKT